MTKIWQILCPDCGGVLAESENSNEILKKEYTCDGPHDEKITFIGQLKHISHRFKEEEGLIKYDKLVRDRIPEIIELNNCECNYHVATDEEYSRYLHKKLIEEGDEFKRKPCAEELADILEVVDALRKFYDIPISEIKHKKLMKNVNRGAFDKKLILDSTREKNVKSTEVYRED